MKIKLKGLLLGMVAIVIILVVVLFWGKYGKPISINEPSVRGKNTDNLTVVMDETTFQIKNNTLVKNYDIIIKNIEEKSLSVIDNYAFFFNNEGFVKFNLDTEETDILNYDVMDFAAAGLNYIYYTVEGDLYKLGADNYCEKIASNVYERLFLYEDSLYYCFGSMFYEINLLDDVISEKMEILGSIKDAVMTEGKIVIVTDDDLYELILEEGKDETY